MAITYPLDIPAELVFTRIQFKPWTVVGLHSSPFTEQAQIQVWPGQGWAVNADVPPLTVAKADPVVAFLLSLNGRQGTFYLGDKSRPTTRGTANGVWTCGAGNTADSTTLVTIGTGQLAVGDWIQVSTYLHKVLKVVDVTHYDVWPRLRSAYANGAALTYTSAKGLFRLTDNNQMGWDINMVKHYGLHLEATEAL